MRILILGLNYLPESTSIGPYTAGLAEYLCRQGHEVDVVTSYPMAPSWSVWDGYRRELFRRERINGVRVTRTFVHVPKDPRRLLNRLLFDFSFTLTSLFGALFTKPCDVVIAISPPLQLGVTGWLLSRLKRATFVFHIQDLVPGVAVAAGMLREGSIAVRIARTLARFVYQRADAITIISEGFRAEVAKEGAQQEKVHVIPNYIDLRAIHPTARENSFRAKHGISSSDFLVMYSGSVGPKQGLETLIDAAAHLQSDPDIRFCIVGDGPSLADMKSRAQQSRVGNILFLPLQPSETLREQLGAADVLAITQRAAVNDSAFPGKLLYYMAVARPIVAAVGEQSETGRFVSKHGIGVVTPAENSFSLSEAIAQMKRQDLTQIGRRARAVAEELFDQSVVLPRFASLFAERRG